MSRMRDLIFPAWAALTAPQKAAWATFAAANPYTNFLGEITSTSGYNMFTSVNTWLITTDEDDHLTAPPTNLLPPPRVDLHATSLRTKALLEDGSTRRHGKIFLVLDDPVPPNTLYWIRNVTRYTVPKYTSFVQPHKLTYVRPGESGTIDLTTFRGLPTPAFHSFRRQTIVGVRARRQPNRPAGQIVAVNMLNGRYTIGNLFHDH